MCVNAIRLINKITDMQDVYHLKQTQQQSRVKMKLETGEPRVIDSPSLPRDTRVKITLVARPLLMPVAQKLFRCESDVLYLKLFDDGVLLK
jgi:hypothetical protein